MEPLYIVRLVLDRRALLRVGARHHLKESVDTGSLLHAGLSQLFAQSGEHVKLPLHTFAEDEEFATAQQDPEHLYVLGYTSHDEPALRSKMGAERDSLLRECRTKRMPDEWRPGHRLHFQVSACPIVRLSSPAGALRKGAEVDAFLARALRAGANVPVDRDEVYRDWIRAEIERRGGARLESTSLTRFQLQRVYRRTQGQDRRGQVSQRPCATFAGELEVTQTGAFNELLRRGIGRHRAFGFGMVLLKPSRSSSSC